MAGAMILMGALCVLSPVICIIMKYGWGLDPEEAVEDWLLSLSLNQILAVRAIFIGGTLLLGAGICLFPVV